MGLLPIAAALAFAACGGSSAPPAPTPITLTAGEILDNTREAMGALETFRFRLTHPKGATLLAGGFTIREAEGVIKAPDQLSLSAEATFAGAFVKIDAVIFPDVTYMTNPLTGNWNRLQGADSPFSIFDPPALVSDILTYLNTVNLVEAGDSIILAGQLPASAMRALVGETQPDTVLDYEMLVDPATFRMLRIDLNGVITAGEAEDTQRRITVSGFNEPVDIRPPIPDA